MIGKRVLIAAAGVHFALTVAVCSRDTFTVVAKGGSLLPQRFENGSQNGQALIESVLGQNLSKRNPIRRIVGAYVNAAGIETGYGFFAPSIPGTNKLTFELHRVDGTVEYQLPNIRSAAAEFRLANLLDVIARVKDETVREGLIKYLAYAVWREHPDVASMHAILGTTDFPSPESFARGKRESNRTSHVYDFSFEVKPEK